MLRPKTFLLALAFASAALTGICQDIPASERSSQGAIGSTRSDVWQCVGRVITEDGRGSGALVAKDIAGNRSVVVTAFHVIRGTSGRGQVAFPVTGEVLQYEIFKTDPSNDVATLVLSGVPKVNEVAISDIEPKPGDQLVLAGWGGSPRQGFFATAGKFTSPVLSSHVPNVFRAHAEVATVVSQGDSGGPALLKGHVAGVISMGNDEIAVVAAYKSGIIKSLLPPWGCPSGNCPAPPQRPAAGRPATPAAPQVPVVPPSSNIAQIQASIDALAAQIESIQRPQAPPPFIPGPAPAPHTPEPEREASGPDLWDLAGKAALVVAGALGVGIPTWAALAWRVGGRVHRRRKRRRARKRTAERVVVQEVPRVVATDTPPLPGKTIATNHYVPYEVDGVSAAHEWANEQLARKYPGSISMIEAHKSLVNQYLGGATNG